MAIAFSTITKHPGSHRSSVDITLDGAYAAGGYAVTSAQWGIIGDPTAVVIGFATANGLTAQWDTTNKKIKIYQAGTEVTSGSLSTAVVIRAIVFGNPVL